VRFRNHFLPLALRQKLFMQFRLSSPYPAPRPDRTALLSSLFMGGFVALFLLYFRPYGLNSGPYADAPERVAFFGFLTFLSYMILEMMLPLLAPRWFDDRHWKVWHRIAYYLLLMWLIASLNGLYINYLQQLSFSWGNYGRIIVQTLALGVLPITMIVLFRFNQKSVFYLKQAEAIRLGGATTDSSPLAPANSKAGKAATSFLAAEAFGNYVKVYFETEGGHRQEVERTTLAKLVADKESEGVVRCHRSFAVQPAYVREVSGNAQGLKLLVGKGDLEVPVSRSFLPAVRTALG